jgi:hypothetical protein
MHHEFYTKNEDEYEPLNDQSEEIEGRDIDSDAMAFIKAKRNVDELHRAKKFEKKTGATH